MKIRVVYEVCFEVKLVKVSFLVSYYNAVGLKKTKIAQISLKLGKMTKNNTRQLSVPVPTFTLGSPMVFHESFYSRKVVIL